MKSLVFFPTRRRVYKYAKCFMQRGFSITYSIHLCNYLSQAMSNDGNDINDRTNPVYSIYEENLHKKIESKNKMKHFLHARKEMHSTLMWISSIYAQKILTKRNGMVSFDKWKKKNVNLMTAKSNLTKTTKAVCLHSPFSKKNEDNEMKRLHFNCIQWAHMSQNAIGMEHISMWNE